MRNLVAPRALKYQVLVDHPPDQHPARFGGGRVLPHRAGFFVSLLPPGEIPVFPSDVQKVDTPERGWRSLTLGQRPAHPVTRQSRTGFGFVLRVCKLPAFFLAFFRACAYSITSLSQECRSDPKTGLSSNTFCPDKRPEGMQWLTKWALVGTAVTRLVSRLKYARFVKLD